MTILRSYATGTDGTIPGIGGCPFDMDRLQKDYVDGAITPTKIINFGANAAGQPLATEISMDVVPLQSCDGKQCLDVLACSGFYEVSTLNFRVSNLHRPGAARASDVWVAVPDNIIIPQLMQRLHQGAVEKIVIGSLAMLGPNGDKDLPTVVQTHEYEVCYIKFVDSLSYGNLSVFSFSFKSVMITQVDYTHVSTNGVITKGGQRSYNFNYNNATGALS